jgi:DNA-binding NtrC family response regulator
MKRFYPNDKAKVLFVDDQQEFLNMLKRRLRQETYEQFYTTNIDEAFEILKKERIDVIVSDMNMPGMNGVELFKKLRDMHPNVIRVALSGLAQITNIIAAVNDGYVFKYITKPWKVDDSGRQVIYDAIEYSVFRNLRLSCDYNSDHVSIEKLKEVFNILEVNYGIREISKHEVGVDDMILNAKYFVKKFN